MADDKTKKSKAQGENVKKKTTSKKGAKKVDSVKKTTKAKNSSAKSTNSKKKANKTSKTKKKAAAVKVEKTEIVENIDSVIAPEEIAVEYVELEEQNVLEGKKDNPEETLKVNHKKKKSDNREEASSEIETILGVELPCGMDKEEKRVRFMNYIKDATIFAIIIPVLDLFAMLFIEDYKAYAITNNIPVNYCLTLLIDFAMVFVMTFLIDSLHGEYSARKMNRVAGTIEKNTLKK